MLDIDPEDPWRRRAACDRDEVDPTWFISRHACDIACDTPEGCIEGRGISERRARVTAAKTLCATCPVLAECRDAFLAIADQVGVAGGLSQGERKALRIAAMRQAEVA